MTKFFSLSAIVFFTILSPLLWSQELNCSVQVNSMQVEGSEKTTFEALQQSLHEFVNNRRWTDDKFSPHERIDCSMLVTIDKQASIDQFEASIQVNSTRPVYGSNYTSTIFKHQDKDFNFQYLRFDVLDFSETTFMSNLTSVVAYYAYVIIAMDYDTYAPFGGDPYWQKAQQIVNNAQNASAIYQKGWLAFENRNNRYWLVQNALDPRFKPLRKTYYDYHRKGFDAMAENVASGRKEVLSALKQIREVHKAEPVAWNTRIFFTAKNEEIIKLFSQAYPEEQADAIQLLEEVDPANTTKYSDIRVSR